jgi:hypothetical protein
MTPVETIEDKFVGEPEAAEFYGVKPQTLAAWRLRGTGPAFHKIGRLVRYKLSELARYAESRRCENTAQADRLED